MSPSLAVRETKFDALTLCSTYSKKGSWTTEEEQHLALLHVCYGNKWAKIAQSMPGREYYKFTVLKLLFSNWHFQFVFAQVPSRV